MLGAMAISDGTGNTEKQLQMMMYLHRRILALPPPMRCCSQRKSRIAALRIRLICSMQSLARNAGRTRRAIIGELGVDIFDIYGLTEVYGLGISVSRHEHQGLHYWMTSSTLRFWTRIRGSAAGRRELGELTITTLTKQGAPPALSAHMTYVSVAGECPCGLQYPRHDIILGRTDDIIRSRRSISIRQTRGRTRRKSMALAVILGRAQSWSGL